MSDLAYALGKQAAIDIHATTAMKAIKKVTRGLSTKAIQNTVVQVIKDLLADKAQLRKSRNRILALGIPGAAAGMGGAYYLGRRAGAKEE